MIELVSCTNHTEDKTTIVCTNSKSYVSYKQDYRFLHYDSYIEHYYSGKVCPICGVVNLVWCDYARLLEDHEVDPEKYSSAVRGHTITLIESCDVAGIATSSESIKIAVGSGSWDSNFGDDCGSCLNHVINT